LCTCVAAFHDHQKKKKKKNNELHVLHLTNITLYIIPVWPSQGMAKPNDGARAAGGTIEQ